MLAWINEFWFLILLAGFLGGIVGFDREKLAKNRKAFNFAGIRTSSLIAILGALLPLIFSLNFAIGVLLCAAFLAALVGSFLINILKNQETGATSEIAILLTLVIGYLVGSHMIFEGIFMSLMLVLILSFKKSIHLFVEKVSTRDFKFTVFFLIFALVILPLLKDVDLGPFGFFNPKEVWMMVTLITGVSFVSYILERIFSNKHTLYLTAFLGGIISSTATALNLALLIKKGKNTSKLINAIILTSLAMFVRVFIEVGVVNYNLSFKLLTFISLLVLLSLFTVYLRNQKSEKVNVQSLAYEKPFEIKQAVTFAIFFSFIQLVIGFLSDRMGDSGVYLSSFVSGFIDTDAVSLALASKSLTELSMTVAMQGVILALVANTIMKLIIVYVKGSKLAARKLTGYTTAVIFIGYICFNIPM